MAILFGLLRCEESLNKKQKVPLYRIIFFLGRREFGWKGGRRAGIGQGRKDAGGAGAGGKERDDVYQVVQIDWNVFLALVSECEYELTVLPAVCFSDVLLFEVALWLALCRAYRERGLVISVSCGGAGASSSSLGGFNPIGDACVCVCCVRP